MKKGEMGNGQLDKKTIRKMDNWTNRQIAKKTYRQLVNYTNKQIDNWQIDK